MGRRVGGVDEERLSVAVVLVDVTDELVGIRAGGKETFLRGFDPFVVFHVHAFRYDHVAAGPRQQREGAVKAPVDRPLPGLGPQVPLAGHIGAVTDLGKAFRERSDPFVKVGFVADSAFRAHEHIGSEHGTEARDVVIGSREHHRAGGRTHGKGVEIRERHRP